MTRRSISGWLFVCAACGEPSSPADDVTGGGPGGSEGGSEAGEASAGTNPGTTDATTSSPSTTDDGSESSADESGSESGDDSTGGEPTTTAVCNGDGVCDRDLDETCAACPDECGSCEIEDLPNQRAKYVDEACPNMGDGLVDTCADSNGGPGRFNSLQPALQSLVAGDTLYVHPGDYWRDVEASDSGAVHSLGEDQDGTLEQPIVVTAADRNALPVLWSCDPSGAQHCPAPAFAAYGDYVVIDHLAIRGRAQIWGGSHSTLQYLDCTVGWGACGDGNWSCLRIESSVNGHAHHNNVHDIEGDGVGGACDPGEPVDFEDRGCGLKEFSSDGAVWEFNTVVAPPRWGYDLHRNSMRTTIRFNEFVDVYQGITIARTVNPKVYGNVIRGNGTTAESCTFVQLLNENAEAEPHLAEVHHNTCIAAQSGVSVQWEVPADVHDNVFSGLISASESPRNVELQVIESADHNAYDSAGNFRRVTYEPDTYSETLADWQAATSQDASSIAADGGPCTFVDAPNDLHIVEGECATLGSDGGPVGPYAITSCVGHECG
ncbi:MAG TPA: hypothetical protein VG755_22935 [Nannocystaceae bacterium]|nr:hypothetical protein [Nannocystaceae bacterium]